MTNTEPAQNWARSLAKGLVSEAQLKSQGLCEDINSEEFEMLKANFDVRVPESFLGTEALRKQVEPNSSELIFHPEELEDPIGDEAHTPIKGLTHRYPDRALVKLNHHCAMYCRFCFRRYKVSQPGELLSEDQQNEIIQYLNSHTEIWEVILTGGDPLVLTDKQLNGFLEKLADVKHIRVLRFHTRIPSALPSRVTQELVHLLKRQPYKVWIVSHINTADELSAETVSALDLFMANGLPVLSQSVLLRGVNATSKELIRLFRELVILGVKPYYLHYPDLAKGTDHFRVPLQEALSLIDSLRGQLSGTCIPQFILDIPNGFGKVAIQMENLRKVGALETDWEVRSPKSQEWIRISYPPLS